MTPSLQDAGCVADWLVVKQTEWLFSRLTGCVAGWLVVRKNGCLVCYKVVYQASWLWSRLSPTQTSRINICSTPDVHYMLISGVLQMYIIWQHLDYSRWTICDKIWSTPDVHSMMISGVLQMYIIRWHLEYSRCTLYEDIWSTPDVNSGVNNITWLS
jgi:hypothetical protein